MPAEDRTGPDMTPWDRQLTERVQPVLSALFHDIMSPLTLLKSRLYLMRRQLQAMRNSPDCPPDFATKLDGLLHLINGLDEAGNRIHKGMMVPRDAVWEALLEGTPFEPAKVIHQIAESMKSGESNHLTQSQTGPVEA